MSNPVDHINAINEPQSYYTASMSPYLQGIELTQMWQLTNYINVKARSNTNFVTVLQGHLPNETDDHDVYDDTWAHCNFGEKNFQFIRTYTPGRDPALGPTGRSLYVSYMTSGTQGYVMSGSKRSAASLDVSGRFDTYVSHRAERRDLGQSLDYNDSLPFEEPDCVNINPAILLSSHHVNVLLPTAMVQAATPANADGVIEPLTIRKVVDRSALELPFVARSIKGHLSISDERGESTLIEDCHDVRQSRSGFNCMPFLDSVGNMGRNSIRVDQPGAFSDVQQTLVPFSDIAREEQAYDASILDTQIFSLFASGVLSGSSQFHSAPAQVQSKHCVVSRHGFTFSQNDNFCYDSIAFGGLLK